MDEVQKKLGVYTDQPLLIVLYPDEQQWDAAALATGQTIVEKSGAWYQPPGIIHLKPASRYFSNKELQIVLLHEYMHHFTQSFYPYSPLWFNEGMAVYFSEGISLERDYAFLLSDLHNPTPLQQMHSYPKNSAIWPAFYGKSAFAVRTLFNKYPERFRYLWEHPQGGFGAAFYRAFGFSEEGFNKVLQHEIAQRRLWGIIFGVSTILGLTLPILVILGGLKKLIVRWRYHPADETANCEQEKSPDDGA